jgi:hypothetical protein
LIAVQHEDAVEAGGLPGRVAEIFAMHYKE